MERNEMKTVGIKWLGMLDLPAKVKDAFEVDGTVYVSEAGNNLHPCDDRQKELLKRAEEESGCLGIFAIEQIMPFGVCFNVLVVPSYEEDLPLNEKELKEGYPFAYVINEMAPMCSEFGTIAIKRTKRGMMRTE